MSDALFDVNNLNQRVIGISLGDKKNLTVSQLESILQASVHGNKLISGLEDLHVAGDSEDVGLDMDKLVLTYEEYTSHSLPLLTANKKYPRNYTDDPELRKQWGVLYVLCYLFKEAMHVYVEDIWRYEHNFVPPSNMKFYSLHDLRPDADPHQHGIPEKAAIATVLERRLLLGTIEDSATHKHYALYPLLSMSPDALWDHLRSQPSLIDFVKQTCQAILDNVAADTLTWYPVHEAYQDFNFRPWQFAIDSELRCPHCGTRVSVQEVLLDNGTLKITVGTLAHVVERQASELPVCKGDDFTSHICAPITIPSGDMVFVDWFRHPTYNKNLRPENSYDTSRWYSINYLLGRFQQMQDYATKNVMFGGVGNEHVAVYQFEGGILVAGHSLLDSDEDYEKEDYDELFYPSLEQQEPAQIAQIVESAMQEPSGLTHLGNICTDLWGYTLVDTCVISQLVEQPCSFDESGKLTLVADEERCQYDATTSSESYAGGTTLGRATIEPGRYMHYYLHHYSPETALSHLPEQVAKLIKPYQFDTIHGVLLKMS